MNRIVDIHMHIVPDVDDGSGSLEESILLLKRSADQGVETVIATPHSWAIDTCGINHVFDQFAELKQEVQKQRISVSLHLGCEMLVYPNTVDKCIRKLDEGEFPTMANSNFVLTEFMPFNSQQHIERCTEAILDSGYVPIIAHAERYMYCSVEGIKKMKEYGVMIQINAFSIANEKDPRIRQFANGLLSERLVDFIGSDAHRMRHRPPIIDDGIAVLSKLYTEEYAKHIAWDNPNNLILCR